VAQGFGYAQGPTNLIVSNILKVCWTFIAAAWHSSGRGLYYSRAKLLAGRAFLTSFFCMSILYS
jgi:hypothetical protein